MKFTKSKILPVTGLIVLAFFMAMSYFNNHIFLDKIMICSFILGLVFFAKIKGESSVIHSGRDGSASTDAT